MQAKRTPAGGCSGRGPLALCSLWAPRARAVHPRSGTPAPAQGKGAKKMWVGNEACHRCCLLPHHPCRRCSPPACGAAPQTQRTAAPAAAPQTRSSATAWSAAPRWAAAPAGPPPAAVATEAPSAPASPLRGSSKAQPPWRAHTAGMPRAGGSLQSSGHGENATWGRSRGSSWRIAAAAGGGATGWEQWSWQGGKAERQPLQAGPSNRPDQ